MEDIRTQGGVDPQYLSTIETQVVMMGENPRNITSKSSDKLRSLAELLFWLKQRDDWRMRRKILPPPAPNSTNAINIVRERLIHPSERLQGPTTVGTGSVFLTE
jgi:hypothetical protein